ncbi:MAG: ATP-binding protein [Acidobacteriota bacterium]
MTLRDYDLSRAGIGHEVAVEGAGAVAAITPRALGQALMNLILNAEQALTGRPRPRLSIDAVRRKGSVVVSVADNGPGVPDELRDAIFMPFFTTNRPGATVGLGLSVARTLVEAAGGALMLSDGPGLDDRGACFRMVLSADA